MNVTIAPSPIHGRGVFANELIEEGHWQYVYGELRRILPGDPCEVFSFEWDSKFYFLPYAPWCCLNHSDTPNCEIEWQREWGMLTIVSLRDIGTREELTINYGYNPTGSEDS